MLATGCPTTALAGRSPVAARPDAQRAKPFGGQVEHFGLGKISRDEPARVAEQSLCDTAGMGFAYRPVTAGTDACPDWSAARIVQVAGQRPPLASGL